MAYKESGVFGRLNEVLGSIPFNEWHLPGMEELPSWLPPRSAGPGPTWDALLQKTQELEALFPSLGHNEAFGVAFCISGIMNVGLARTLSGHLGPHFYAYLAFSHDLAARAYALGEERLNLETTKVPEMEVVRRLLKALTLVEEQEYNFSPHGYSKLAFEATVDALQERMPSLSDSEAAMVTAIVSGTYMDPGVAAKCKAGLALCVYGWGAAQADKLRAYYEGVLGEDERPPWMHMAITPTETGQEENPLQALLRQLRAETGQEENPLQALLRQLRAN